MSSISGSGPIIPHHPLSGVDPNPPRLISNSADVINMLRTMANVNNPPQDSSRYPVAELQTQLTGALTALGTFFNSRMQCPPQLQNLINQLSSQTTYSGLAQVLNQFQTTSLPQIDFYNSGGQQMNTDQLITSIFDQRTFQGPVSLADMGYLVQCLLSNPPWDCRTPNTLDLQELFNAPPPYDPNDPRHPSFQLSEVDNANVMCVQTLLRQWQGHDSTQTLTAWIQHPSNAGMFLNAILMGSMATLDQPVPSSSQLSQLNDLWTNAMSTILEISNPSPKIQQMMDQLTNDLTTGVATATIQSDWAKLQSLFEPS